MKRRKIEIPESLERRIQEYQRICNCDEKNAVNQIIKNGIPQFYHKRLSYYVQKLPFSVRIYIIDYISFLNSRFLVRETNREIPFPPVRLKKEDVRQYIKPKNGKEDEDEDDGYIFRYKFEEIVVHKELSRKTTKLPNQTKKKGTPNTQTVTIVQDKKGRYYKLTSKRYFSLEIFSYKLEKAVDFGEFISLMYGYFKGDYTRKIYLVFGYLVYRMNNFLIRIPQHQTRQLYFLNGTLPNHKQQITNKLTTKLSKSILPNKESDDRIRTFNFIEIPSNLKNFCLSEIRITEKNLILLLEKLKKLKKFAVKKITGLRNREVLEFLKKVTIIRVMDCRLDSESVNFLLSNNTTTRSLNLCENFDVTSEGFRNFKDTKINLLCADDTFLDNWGIKHLEKQHFLHELQINNTNVDHEGVLNCFLHKTIRKLEIGYIDFNEWPAELSEFPRFKHNTKKFARIDPIDPALLNCKSLERLFLDGSKFNHHFLLFLLKYCTNISTVSCFNTSLTNDKLSIILNLPKLDTLFASYNPQLTKLSVIKIARKDGLKRLDYRQHQLTNSDAQILFSSSSLEDLWIDGEEISNDALINLPENQVLKFLTITGENKIDQFGLSFIKNGCKNLIKIKYSKTDSHGNAGEESYFLEGMNNEK